MRGDQASQLGDQLGVATRCQVAWTRSEMALGTTSSAEHRLAPSVTHWVPGRAVTGSAPAAVLMWAVTGWPPGPQPAPTGTSEAYPVPSGDLSCSQFVWPSAVRGSREI